MEKGSLDYSNVLQSKKKKKCSFKKQGRNPKWFLYGITVKNPFFQKMTDFPTSNGKKSWGKIPNILVQVQSQVKGEQDTLTDIINSGRNDEKYKLLPL